MADEVEVSEQVLFTEAGKPQEGEKEHSTKEETKEERRARIKAKILAGMYKRYVVRGEPWGRQRPVREGLWYP